MATISRRSSRTLITLATCYADQADDALVIPEDLTTLTDDEVAALAARADEAFDTIYGDGTAALSDADYATLGDLTTGIEALAAEQARREEAANERREAAAALAARARPAMSTESTPDAGDSGDEEDEDTDEDDEDADDEDADDSADAPADEAAEVVTAAGTTQPRGRLAINLRSANRNAPKRQRQPQTADRSMRDVAYATSDALGYADHAGLDWLDAGRMLDRRIGSFSLGQYQAAQARGQHIREQHSLMAFKRETPKELLVASTGPEAMMNAMNRAVDVTRLPGGALTAAGWCAPSDTLYDLCSNASRDGIISLPEVGVQRGGINVPVNPTFAELYSQIGFHFTEEDAIAGNWAPGANPGDPNIAGDKPCYEIECPVWEDHRLEGDGLCIVADLLTVRGYPEMLAWVTQNALIAHDHKVSAGKIAKIVAGSTPITMTTDTVGTTAPLLAAIELQVEHYRYTQRLPRTTTLEAVFPYWIRGAIRQDLSVRLGLAEFDVTDARIDAWFRSRGVAPQYVYDWQALDINPLDTFKTWPSTVDFLLYQAGTWVAGVDDIITLDTLYDSTLLGQNKFLALFTEEAWLVAKRCIDSRVITVPVHSDGSTHAGVLLDADLSPSA
jgi:hypothetical protein